MWEDDTVAATDEGKRRMLESPPHTVLEDGTLSRKRSHRGVVLWLIASQLLALGTLLVWLAVAGFSFMAFDSGPSTMAWILVGSVLSYPLWVIFCFVLAWWWYRRGRFRRAVIVTSIPLVVPLAFGLLMVL
jgi:hypothetical protein